MTITDRRPLASNKNKRHLRHCFGIVSYRLGSPIGGLPLHGLIFIPHDSTLPSVEDNTINDSIPKFSSLIHVTSLEVVPRISNDQATDIGQAFSPISLQESTDFTQYMEMDATSYLASESGILDSISNKSYTSFVLFGNGSSIHVVVSCYTHWSHHYLFHSLLSSFTQCHCHPWNY